jgi:hypothetical protein
MSIQNVNVNNLNQYLKSIIQQQTRTSTYGMSNQYSLVTVVATTSSYTNINPKTGSIVVVGPTGSYTVPQPVINPIPVNTTTSFISTSDNQISVTSSGKEDTIISNLLLNIINIEDVTNSGYTRDNSVLNLYDSISSNYWNPQVNITGSNPYFYKLNYTFDSIGSIYKFAVKNNDGFPGFTNIKLYPTDTPSNYVNITPALDTNNQYVNTTVYLLLDQNSIPLFNTDKMTAEFTLEPSLQPNTFYQYGQCYGVMYTGDAIGLRAGNYINTNTGTGNKLQWVTSYLLNQTTVTGTNNTDNNYLVSYDGQYRIAQNKTFYQVSIDGGNTYTKKTLSIDFNMISSTDGKYISTYKYIGGVSNTQYIYSSLDYGQTFNITSTITGIIPIMRINGISTSGQYQCFLSDTYGSGSVVVFIYVSSNYGSSFNGASVFSFTFPNTPDKYVNLFVQNNGTAIAIFTTAGQVDFRSVLCYFPYSQTSTSPFTSTSLSSIEQNYNLDNSIQGKYKTAFGTISSNQLAIFVTQNNDSSYTTISDNSLFTEWYNTPGISLSNSGIKISPDGSKQVLVVIYSTTTISLYSTNSGSTWNRSNTFPSLLNTFSNIVANNDFSIIQICGGYTYSYNGQTRTDPISYISYDYGNNWTLNSAINPASSFIYTNFYSAQSVTNKTYFQIKDINQNQVLGVSDNGFNMTKDLRVNNSNAYVLGGTLTIGPDTASSLLNNYEVNVDGTTSAKNVILLSDERFKDIIEYLSPEEANKKIQKLQIVKYNYIDRENDKIHTGMIAQQVKEVIEDVVDINSSDYIINNGEETIHVKDVHSIDYNSVISYLLASLQYNISKIEQLEEQLEKFNNFEQLNSIN